MKRITTLGAGLLLLGFIFTGCDTSDAVGPEALSDNIGQSDARPAYGANTCETVPDGFDYCVDLVASQTEKVGEVYYAYEDGAFTIKYQLTDGGLCLKEAHYGVYDTEGAIPFNGGGNLAPGSLDYGEDFDGCTTSYTDVIDGDDGLSLSGDYFVAAHAVVVGASSDDYCPVIAGIGHGADESIWGDLYFVNPNSGFSQFFFETNLEGEASDRSDVPEESYPNGLGYDEDTDTYYYAAGNQDYYKHVVGSGTQSLVATLSQLNAGATGGAVGDGSYYYMKQSSAGNGGDDDLLRFDIIGGAEDPVPVCSDFMMPDGDYDLEFGDMAYDHSTDLLYTSVYLDDEATTVVDMVTRFFSLDPSTCDYDLILQRPGDEKLQLAFGSDGVLYGHSTGNTPLSVPGEFYSIDLGTGARTSLGVINNADGVLLQFNDLAPADVTCDPGFDETAWGWGQQTFQEVTGRNGRGGQWGWIFEGDTAE